MRSSRSAIVVHALLVCGALPACATSQPQPPALTHDTQAPTAAPAAGSSEPAASTSSVAATSAVGAWLALVDQSRYDDSWAAAAPVFQKAVSRSDWVVAVGNVRTPLGKVISRQLQSAQYTTTLPGAPDGKYVVIRFNTAFENKPNAVETVTPVQAPDGTWQVSGYFIK